MARINDISFTHVGKNEGCTCDKCGQYLTNIWTVEYSDGTRINFGIDCFDKMTKASHLNDYGEKIMRKTLKSIEKHQKMYEVEKALTEETDERYQAQQIKTECDTPAWYGTPWAEYHEWMLTVFWPERFKEDQKEIARFSKINFIK